jgi:hypothetical protein
MDIDGARHDEQPGRVDRGPGGRRRPGQVRLERDDLTALDRDVERLGCLGGDDGPTADDEIDQSPPPSPHRCRG